MAWNSYDYDNDDEEDWPHGCGRRRDKAQEAEGEYPHVLEDNEKLLAKCDAVKRQMDAEYESLKPVLKAPMTIPECGDAANWYVQAEIKFWPRWMSLKDPVVKELEEGVAAMFMLEETFESALGGSEDPPKDLDDMWTHVKKLLKQLEDLQKFWTDLPGSNARPRSIRIQQGISQILQNQTAETKMSFHVDYNQFTAHLRKKPSSRPSMEIDQKSIKFVPGKGGDLPLGIATTLYAQCDLETCIALRQANTFWYSCYELSESTLKDKVQERNPWMKPEGEWRTWGDCALVIESRARSYSWLSMESVDTVSLKSLGPKNQLRVWPVVAMKLEPEFGLPHDFEGLESHGLDCSSLCDRVHLVGDRETASLDLWMPAATLDHEPKWEIVASQLAGNVIMYKGLCITLPGTDDLFPEDIRSVIAHDTYVKVCSTTHVYLFSRSRPLHYRYAIIHSNQRFAPGYLMSDTHVTYNTVRVGSYGSNQTANLYYVMDFTTMRLFPQGGGPTRAHPVAIYRGVMWWQTQDGKYLIPTLVDLSRQDWPAYRHDWIISLSQEAAPPLKQITTPGSTHFLVGKTSYGSLLVDLEAREVSALYGASQCPQDKLIPGYLGSRFVLRSLDCHTQKHWSKWAFDKLMGVEMDDDDDENDLSYEEGDSDDPHDDESYDESDEESDDEDEESDEEDEESDEE